MKFTMDTHRMVRFTGENGKEVWVALGGGRLVRDLAVEGPHEHVRIRLTDGTSVVVRESPQVVMDRVDPSYGRAAYLKQRLMGILAVYPHLKKYPEDTVMVAYEAIWDLNPAVADNLLAGGTVLGKVLRSRDPVSPEAPRMDLELAAALLQATPATIQEQEHIP